MDAQRLCRIGLTQLEAAVLDALGDEELTLYWLRDRLGMTETGSAEIVNGVLSRLIDSGELDGDQSGEGEHYRYWRTRS
ncbi:hypothetical protein [Candidatus Poriferisodalis sp.]|uniref:hypothetical protein n=1 Tax=Candidatus Poriferisodalis sp. TaxID=3101277 RepID=UPI003B52A5DC